MAAPEAVGAVAVSRAEVRKSLDRLDYHLGRGTRGARGVRRETAYIDALHRQTIRLSGLATGQPYTTSPASFGRKAAAALATGNTRTTGRIKSSILADFSSDGLQPARDWTLQPGAANSTWVWVANGSACPTCLSKHGQTYKGPFVPSHPSCLCIPETPQEAAGNGVTPLSPDVVADQILNYGDPRYYRIARDLKNGQTTLREAGAVENVNAQSKGFNAWREHMRKQEVFRADGAIPQVPGTGLTLEESAALPARAPTAAKVKEPHPPIDLDDFDANLLRSLLDDGLDPTYDLTAIRKQILDRLAALGESAVKPAKPFRSLGELADETFKKLTNSRITKTQERNVREAIRIAEQKIAGLPPEVRRKFSDALEYVGQLRLEALREIPKSGKMTLGHWAPRSRIPRRGYTNKELMLQTKRIDTKLWDDYVEEANKWAKANNEAFERGKAIRGSFDDAHQAAREHKLANPGPTKPTKLIVDATPDEIASTLVHELTHVIDTLDDLIPRRQAGEMWNLAAKYHAEGQQEFWYAASRYENGRQAIGETVAEISRFYVEGWPKSGVSAAEWRARYPEMARFAEEVIYA